MLAAPAIAVLEADAAGDLTAAAIVEFGRHRHGLEQDERVGSDVLLLIASGAASVTDAELGVGVQTIYAIQDRAAVVSGSHRHVATPAKAILKVTAGQAAAAAVEQLGADEALGHCRTADGQVCPIAAPEMELVGAGQKLHRGLVEPTRVTVAAAIRNLAAVLQGDVSGLPSQCRVRIRDGDAHLGLSGALVLHLERVGAGEELCRGFTWCA